MAKEQKEKVKELTEKLHEGIKNLFESDRYRDYLKTMAKFTNYSFNNTVLISLQRPDTMAVAGYVDWQKKFGRTVKPGAKGIQIIQPAPWKYTAHQIVKDADGNPIKDQDGNEVKQEVERTYQGYKVGYVYAYEDTEGKELPSIVSILDQDVKNYTAVMDALKKISPVPIRFDKIRGGINGYYDLKNREIVVKVDLPDAQKVKTSIHEIAHGILHDKVTGEDPQATQREREVSAESVAFIVCSWLGVDTSEYSFGYIGGWSAGKELLELQTKMETIRKTANGIISSLETELMKNTVVDTLEKLPMIAEVTVVPVQKEKPHHSVSHRRR